MAENDRAPRLRFKGFTEDWKQHKLGECFNERQERSADGELISVTINEGIKKFSELGRYDNSSEDKSHYKKVEPGDIAYNSMRMWQGASGVSMYSGILSPAYTVLAPYDGVNSLFFSFVFKRPDVIHTFKINSQGITSDNWNLKYPALSEIECAMPSFDEQGKIAKLLKRLDDIIDVNQCKYEKFVETKKSLLENMFPTEGESTPRIRVKGFSEVWKQKKLNEVADKVIEKNISMGYNETFTNSAEYGVVSQRDYFDHDISNVENLAGYYVVRDGDFVYNPRISVTAPVGPINCNKLGRSGVMSPLYTVFRTHDIDCVYLEQYFKSSHWHSYMRMNGDSGARSDRFSIKDDLFFEMTIPYPRIAEQIKIGNFLTSVDDAVALQKQKVEKLKSIKSALLDKMFV